MIRCVPGQANQAATIVLRISRRTGLLTLALAIMSGLVLHWQATRDDRALAQAMAATVTVRVVVPEPVHDPEKASGPLLYRATNGTGFFIDAAGHIITNAHVVDGAVRIDIETADGRHLRGRLLGSDRLSDVAVVTIDARDTPFLAFAPSRPRIGENIFTVGAPYELTGSVSRGVVAGLGRSLRSSFPNWLIQHTALIDPGSSGGPLLNAAGEVLGINAALPDGRFDFGGIAFAVEGAVVQRFARAILDGGIDRASLGITVRAIDVPLAMATASPGDAGVLVETVGSQSPAAGRLQPGDLLTAINGARVPSLPDAVRILAQAPAGVPIHLRYVRAGQPAHLEIMPARSRPEARQNDFQFQDIGIELAAPGEPRITAIRPGSLAAATALRAGDLILAVNLRAVASADEARRALAVAGPLVAISARRGEAPPRTIVLGSDTSAQTRFEGNERGTNNADL